MTNETYGYMEMVTKKRFKMIEGPALSTMEKMRQHCADLLRQTYKEVIHLRKEKQSSHPFVSGFVFSPDKEKSQNGDSYKKAYCGKSISTIRVLCEHRE